MPNCSQCEHLFLAHFLVHDNQVILWISHGGFDPAEHGLNLPLFIFITILFTIDGVLPCVMVVEIGSLSMWFLTV